jgi:SAM-dependent methyltransferase/uncharacterized protein YbaR (Trm112 family)
MKLEFTRQLRCPGCRSEHTLELRVQERDEHEVREAMLRCAACLRAFPVHRGVPELMHEPPAHIVREAAGLARFAEQMRLEGWDRERVRGLPYVQQGYWYVQARSMDQVLTTVPFKPGESVLDVGSNTCWASNHFAVRGLRPIALDITTVELQGLYTAEYFIDGGEVFFERVLGSMDAIPLCSSSVDYVYCCEVLHHNDTDSLRRTFAEIFRVLRPGGRLLVINETLKTLRDPSGVNLEGVEQYEGYEHAHWALRYRWEAMRAGFLTQVAEPHYHAFFGEPYKTPDAPVGRLHAGVHRLAFKLRTRDPVRRAYLAWLNHAHGGVSLNMIATKPNRYIGRHDRMSAPQRLLRTVAAWLRLPLDRRRGRAPARLPRKPVYLRGAAG